MSNLIVNNIQIGNSATPSQNITLSTPSILDGSIKLSVGNIGSTTKDLFKIHSNGNLWVNGAILENHVQMTGNNIDLSAAAVFSKTISSATTFTLTNLPDTNQACSFMLNLTNGGAYTVTWWSGVKWSGGVAPTLTASGRDMLSFVSYDGGATWNGILLGKDMK